MSNRLGGKQGTAYTGTNANQPPNWTFSDRAPTQYDTQNVSVGDLWLNNSAVGIGRVWILVSLNGDMYSKGALAQWEQLSADLLETLTSNIGGPVPPDSTATINVVGDTTTILGTGNPATNTITLSTTGSVPISFPTDNGTAFPIAGVLNIKTFGECGATVLTSGSVNDVEIDVSDNAANTLIGRSAGNPTFSGMGNTTVGSFSLNAITTATDNSSLGSQALENITTGNNNIGIGFEAGVNYISSESSNIVIGNSGTVTESNVIRIGTNGSSSGQQNACYIAGIYAASVDPSTDEMVLIDSTNKLGSTNLSALSWTPTLSFGNLSTGITYSIQEGIYQTIGSLVFYSGSIGLSSKGSATGNARVVGLPFTSSGTFQTQFGQLAIGNISLGSGYTYAWCINDIGTNKLLLSTGGDGVSQILLDDTDFADDSALSITGFYFRT